ncbi:hypothetical protein [Clostridium peptidivorans]|uniref:hypothetical protein n=1 Tax=Clostridium peptidivorans TaxID=100174 RepID=UPI001A9A5137|nr:hypothetical protein [Clostridium peptidivorans]
MKNKDGRIGIITFVVSYVLVHSIFKLFNFKYDIFSEPFNILKFIIDFGSWMIIWVLVYSILEKMQKSK